MGRIGKQGRSQSSAVRRTPYLLVLVILGLFLPQLGETARAASRHRPAAAYLHRTLHRSRTDHAAPRHHVLASSTPVRPRFIAVAADTWAADNRFWLRQAAYLQPRGPPSRSVCLATNRAAGAASSSSQSDTLERIRGTVSTTITNSGGDGREDPGCPATSRTRPHHPTDSDTATLQHWVRPEGPDPDSAGRRNVLRAAPRARTAGVRGDNGQM
jgi:hypothetical protein